MGLFWLCSQGHFDLDLRRFIGNYRCQVMHITSLLKAKLREQRGARTKTGVNEFVQVGKIRVAERVGFLNLFGRFGFSPLGAGLLWDRPLIFSFTSLVVGEACEGC
jgi:hypothetical protein